MSIAFSNASRVMRDWERSSSQWPQDDLQSELNDRTEWDCLIGLMNLS